MAINWNCRTGQLPGLLHNQNRETAAGRLLKLDAYIDPSARGARLMSDRSKPQQRAVQLPLQF